MNPSPTERPIPTDLLGDVLWRRLDLTCLEHCRVVQAPDFCAIQGTVLLSVEGVPCRIHYGVQCDLSWVTRGAHVTLLRGREKERLELRRDQTGVWSRDGQPIPAMDGLIDVDLAFTPSTNTLPIRRLDLDVGDDASLDAVWIQFPSLAIDRLPQRYVRASDGGYTYESRGGSFKADLEVDDEGIVIRYGEIWERVAG